MNALGNYFMPYQRRWIADQSRYKLAEKSRRVGLTYAQSFEDVRDAARAEKPMDVWFSSADESAAKEYIRYCAQWAKIMQIAAEDLGEIVISRDDDIKALAIQLATGKRIHGLTSNPTAFRSKGGKLVLDEFAFHKDQGGMWKAARPVITWGFPVRIISTYNGRGNLYYQMVNDTRRAMAEGRKPLWNLHSISIQVAVAEGLADKLVGRRLTDAERERWLEAEREACQTEDAWQQEYCCNPVDETTAWLSYELIAKAESPAAGHPELYEGGDCYVGMDIARRRDLTVIWVIERVGDVYWTREVIRLHRRRFAEQLAELDSVFQRYRVVRACLDQTGIGEAPVESAQDQHGAMRVEGVLMTGPVKQELAIGLKRRMEDAQCRIPAERATREAHHAVRKLLTTAGNARFDAERTDAGHADEFWAHALALHAADAPLQPAAGASIEPDSDLYRAAGFAGYERTEMFGRARRPVGRAGGYPRH